jgi:hypothetical protein
MENSLIPYEMVPASRVFAEVSEAFDLLNLTYFSVDLLERFHFSDEHDLDQAVERAIRACQVLNIPIRKHFRKVFWFRETGIQRGWRLSALGCYLTLINEDPGHPDIAGFQAFLFADF